MVRWSDLVLSNEHSAEAACAIFDCTGAEEIVIVDRQGHPLGLLSDSDTRAHLLSGGSLDVPAVQLARADMPVETVGAGGFQGLHGQRATAENTIVLVDGNRRVVGLRRPRDQARAIAADTLVVLMVGGAGTRLRPLTDNCPKPLLPVRGKALLERTIERLANLGFRRLCLAVGHQADQIINYFKNGSRWNVDITYLIERDRLGTCGALRLLPELPQSSFLVMNGDLITDVRFDSLVRFHRAQNAGATVCVHEYSVDVPYGVVECRGTEMAGFKEKPRQKHWISAGMYVLEPEAIGHIPDGQKYDMPDLLQSVRAGLKRVSVYAIRERWIDIGCIEEYERANREPEPQLVKQEDVVHPVLVSRMMSLVTY